MPAVSRSLISCSLPPPPLPHPVDTSPPRYPQDIRTEMEKYTVLLQQSICKVLEEIDGKGTFREHRWSHTESGGGVTRIMENGSVFEKAGVNTSSVSAMLTDALAARLGVNRQRVGATGISLVLHPSSPMVPTVHMNLRYVSLENGDAWFGGGADLTPSYLDRDDAVYFHRTLKSVCDAYDPTWYPLFKEACDNYFFIKHRGEARGIGGIFFDYRRDEPARHFSFVRDLGRQFLPSYVPIVERARTRPWGESEKLWQRIRRGRYVEFNLVYDRGTLFGLETGGRIDSILMSLPPDVAWPDGYTVAPGSREEDLVRVLQHPVAWV